MARKQKYRKLLYMLLTLFLLVVTIVGGRGVFPVFAYTSNYTSVLTDLQKDSNFNVDNYPYKADDYSIQVIQIAESVNGELFVYAYQPCQQTQYLVATEINMSLAESVDGTRLYGLTLINISGVFGKYKVNDIAISNKTTRYYNITSIYREWLKGIDEETGNDNIINGVAFDVGKLFKAETIDGSVKYSCRQTDTVEIKNPYVDFLSYYDGATWGSLFGLEPDKYTDVHYIAFSTDKKIDTLKEADVTYRTQTYKKEAFNKGTTYGEKSKPLYITLTGEMDISANKYTWKCIQRTEDFIKNTNLNSTTENEVKKSEFVLVFLTTPYTQKEVYSFMQGHSYEVSGTQVSNVSILRLMFETDGITYNLGALMNQQQGDDKPGNAPDPVESIGFWAYIWRCIVRLFNGTATLVEQIIAVVVIAIAVLFLPALLTVLSLVFPAFGAVVKSILHGIITALKYLFIGLWYIISAPFRFIAWLVRKCRGE